MRIRYLKINEWRYFQNIELKLDDHVGLVCIVGANGTGKTHVLELISACAHKFGLSPGVETPRGDPFSDPHDFTLQFYLAQGISEPVDQGLSQRPSFVDWDRTLTIQSSKIGGVARTKILAGGILEENESISFASLVIQKLQSSTDVYFLSLDADRAYPKKTIQTNEIGQAYDTDWEGIEYTRGRSFKATTTLYDEWIKYFLARENQAGTRLIKDIRIARQSRNSEPTFTDHFDAYKEALRKILPHVLFTGVDPKRRTLLFDTTGIELSFNQLSGGEREIAFLIGQIDRFGLREGLFLLDEPELHLNADLIRAWVNYLTSTVKTGQIWLSTHSLEAVEAAGQQATFVLERNEQSNKVDSLVRLDTRPVLSALSRAVGTPAFSISRLLFVFIEGEEGVGERERFRKLAGEPQHIRFIECGSRKEVIRRLSAIRSVASEAEAQIRVGGVVDRDFQTDNESQDSSKTQSVFVLPVHEVENFFLHLATLQALLEQNGKGNLQPIDLVRKASDVRAGSWIFQHMMSTQPSKSLPPISQSAKEFAKSVPWSQFESNLDTTIQTIVDATNYGADDKVRLKTIMQVSANTYGRKRQEDDIWKSCEGKQVLNEVARSTGFAGVSALVQATFALWSRNESLLPRELKTLRDYLATL